MSGVRWTLAVVALAAYVGRRSYRPSALTYGQVANDGAEYYSVFSRLQPSSWPAATGLCQSVQGLLPTVRDNRRRQDFMHALLQMYSHTDDAYMWIDDFCSPGECPPINNNSWLYGNFETQPPDTGGDTISPWYLALGQRSNRLRNLPMTSTLVTTVICQHDEAWRQNCDIGDVDVFRYFECVEYGFCSKSTNITDRHCLCYTGHTGINCTDRESPCASNPCRNGATCSAQNSGGGGGYTCQCISGFSGVTCETDIDDCVNGDTLCSGAPCEDRVNGYYCNCDGTGRRGPNCDEMIDECLSSPCLNGGTCVDQVSGYMCRCANGYDGDNCQNDACHSNPCLNNGTCEVRVDGNYLCRCPNGYEGTNCQGDIDECGSSPCVNDGTCEDDIGSYLCRCAVGYDGNNCQVDIDAANTSTSMSTDGTTSATTSTNNGTAKNDTDEASAALGGGSGDGPLVPAAVGGVVGILAIVVATAMLVKRRRNRAKARDVSPNANAKTLSPSKDKSISRSKGETASPSKGKIIAPKTDKVVSSSSGNIEDEYVYSSTDIDSYESD